MLRVSQQKRSERALLLKFVGLTVTAEAMGKTGARRGTAVAMPVETFGAASASPSP